MPLENLSARDVHQHFGIAKELPVTREGDESTVGNLRLAKNIEDGICNSIMASLTRLNLTPDQVKYRVSRGNITDSPRDVGLITVERIDDETLVLPPLLVKQMGPGRGNELNAIRKLAAAGEYNPSFPSMAAKSWYADSKVVVEELLPNRVMVDGIPVGTGILDRGPLLSSSRDEFKILGERLASTVYHEWENGLVYDIGYVPGKADPGRIMETRIKVLGRGADLRVAFLDWSRSVNTDSIIGGREGEAARQALKQHIGMLMGVVHRCLDDGPDARVWASFERSLVSILPPDVSEGMFFRGILEEVREEHQQPETWGGDEQYAKDWNRFFRRIYRTVHGQPVAVKQVADRTRLVRDLNGRHISTECATAIVDFLEDIVPGTQTFRGLNFRLTRTDGDVEQGYGRLMVRGPEPARETICRLRIQHVAPEQRGDAILAYRASQAGIGSPVLHIDANSIVEVETEACVMDVFAGLSRRETPGLKAAPVPDPRRSRAEGGLSRIPDSLHRTHLSLDYHRLQQTAEQILHNLNDTGAVGAEQIGRQMAVLLSRMLSRNMLVDRTRSEFLESMEISQGPQAEMQVRLRGWDRRARVDMEAPHDETRDRLMTNFMGAVVDACAAAGPHGPVMWREFESYLPQRARRADRREMYSTVLARFKQAESSNPASVRVFDEAAASVRVDEWQMPEEVGAELALAGLHPEPTWGRLKQMCEWSRPQMEAQNIPAGELGARISERRGEFIPLAVKILQTVRETGIPMGAAVSNLRVIGTIYDESSARVHSKRFNPGDETPGPIGDKMDIFRLVDGNPACLQALTNPRFQGLTDLLSYRSAYLAKSIIEVVAERPESLTEIIALEARPRTLDEMKGELSDSMRSVDEWAEAQKVDLSTSEGIEAVHERKVAALRNFSKMSFLRLGYLYTELMRGSLLDAPVQDIYDEVSNLSLAVLDGIFSIEHERLSRLKGDPSSKIGYVIGGASARREFPSFDYDILGVMERHGNTAGGVEGSTTNLDFFTELLDRMGATAVEVGHHLDTGFVIEGTPCATVFEYDGKLRGDSNPKALLGLDNLSYGCGDPELAQQFIDMGSSLVHEPENALRTAAAQVLMREERDRSWADRDDINIKYSPGGLRDLLDVMIVYKLTEGITDSNVFNLLESIAMNQGQREELMTSYIWLMNIRVRLDLEYGRQHKFLPQDEDLNRFARLLGYSDDDGTAVPDFMRDLEIHTRVVRENTDDLLRVAFERHPELGDKVSEIREEARRAQEAEVRRLGSQVENDARSVVDAIIREFGFSGPTADLKARVIARQRGIDLDGIDF